MPDWAETATLPDQVPLGHLTCLGTVTGGPRGPRAVLRTGQGSVFTLKTGDFLGPRTITEIADWGLAYDSPAGPGHLALPGRTAPATSLRPRSRGPDGLRP